MARGKHAARSAKHQIEARDQRIEQLAVELAEAKSRARKFEKDSIQLQATLSEVAQLRQDVERGESRRTRSLEEQIEEARAEREDLLDAVEMVLLELLLNDQKVRSGDLLIDRAGTTHPDAWRRILGVERFMAMMGRLDAGASRITPRVVRRRNAHVKSIQALMGPPPDKPE